MGRVSASPRRPEAPRPSESAPGPGPSPARPDGRPAQGRRIVHVDDSLEEMIREVATLDRADCIAALREFTCPPLDFTDDFLNRQDVDRLRHILLAACLQARKSARLAG